MTQGQPCVQRARPQPHRGGGNPEDPNEESTSRQAIDSRRRRDYKLKVRQARTESEKYHLRLRHHSI